MDVLKDFVEFGKAIWDAIGKQISYSNNLEKNITSLKRKRDDLRVLAKEIDEQVSNAEVRFAKRRKIEVRRWLEDVQKMEDEFHNVELEVGGRENFFWRAKHGKLVEEKLQQVAELYSKGNFSGDFTVDDPNSSLTIPTASIEDGATTERNIKEIWTRLMGEECQKIGVYGLGGVGKTTIMQHINNQLKETGKFDNVIWVTVSQAFSVVRIQDEIAAVLQLDLSTCNDETRKASKLYALLAHKKRYVLILDDLWEAFSLENVGIPEPTSVNGCKLAITTRSLDVCNKMDCKPIQVNLLSRNEAFDLFISKLAPKAKLAPKIHRIAELLVEECAGLPLALVTVAGSMKGVDDIHEWRNALNELTNATEGINDMESKVFERLKFSYNRLKDKKLQQCFLYCALYPEDHWIPRDELIDHWIAEGLIDDLGNLKARIDKGHTILNRLVNTCLLLECVIRVEGYVTYVKLHDVVRDMALKITKTSSRFMVKAGVKLRECLDEDWAKDFERVSLMINKVKKLPSRPPFCRKLLTLLLGRNPLCHISNHFFRHMHNLKVLDLSYTDIESLPESIYVLKNLHELSLEGCKQLSSLFSLEKLEALSNLNLACSGIRHLPPGMDKLMKLEKLNLDRTFQGLEVKLPDIIHVKCLRIDSRVIKCSIQSILSMRRLEILEVVFLNLQKFNKYIRSPQRQQLSGYNIAVGKYIDLQNYHKLSKTVFICGCILTSGEDPLALPCDVQDLWISNCTVVRSLTVQNIRDLETCTIISCVGMETVFHSSAPFEENCNLGSLKELTVQSLPDLRDIFNNVTPTNATPSNLTVLDIGGCPKLRYIFSFRLSLEFKNLKHLSVSSCGQIEVIVTDEMDSSSIEEHDSSVVSFPNLRILELYDLRELKSIYNGLMCCESLEQIQIYFCSQLQRLPLALHKANGQISPPTALKEIKAHEDWWESIKWDEPDAKTTLQRFFRKR